MKSTTRRFLQVWLATSLLCVGTTMGVAIAIGAALALDARAEALRLLDTTAPLPYLLAVMVIAFTGFLATWIIRWYFEPLSATAEATALTAHSNAAHRMPSQGPAELCQLISSINALAERHDAALAHVSARVEEATRAQEADRNRLAVLIAELPQGVIVCNADGLVLLYNERARALLCPPEARVFLGIGRSLYVIVSDAELREAMDLLRERDARGEIDPASELRIRAGARQLRIRISPVAGGTDATSGGPSPAGFVLLLEGTGTQPALSVETAAGGAARTFPAARPVFYDFDLFRPSASDAQLDTRPLRDLTYTVFDTETTGLDPSAGDEIVAIGAVRVVNARIVAGDSFDCLVDPGRPVDPRSTRIHGITDAMLHGQPPIGIVLPRFHAYCADTVLVGHNVAFDLRFLQMKERSTGVRFEQPVLDTLLLSALLHEHLDDDRLEAIAHRFGLEARARHTALGDALLTAEAFLKMVPLLAARGITTLRQAQEESGKTRYARLRY